MLAGSRRYFGAGVLSTLAAEKTGAGYVSLGTPAGAARYARQHLLCSPVIESLEAKDAGHFSASALTGILAELRHIDAICCGPGLTVNVDTVSFVGEVLRYAASWGTPLLLDADALNVLSSEPQLAEESCLRAKDEALAEGQSPLVLTPHAGELARFFDSQERLTSEEAILDGAKRLAARLGAVVVAKGPATMITDGKLCHRSSEATPALAKAGTGDVLAGIISSLLAQGMSAMDASILGVRIHSRAGVLAEKELGRRSVTALDVIDAIPAALAESEPH